MIPNNNLSVLPFFGSIAEQNARRWWIYDKIYPLYTPKAYLPSFQIQREALRTPIADTPVYDILLEQTIGQPMQYAVTTPDYDSTQVITYTIPADTTKIRFVNLPIAPASYSGQACVNIVGVKDDNGTEIVTETATFTEQNNSGVWTLNAATEKIYVLVYNENISSERGYLVSETGIDTTIQSVKLYNTKGELIHDITQNVRIRCSFYRQTNDEYDSIVFKGDYVVWSDMPIGQYYIEFKDLVNTWYSDVFTAVDNMQPYLKIVWWDEADFVMDAGTIFYRENWKNTLYLRADIAKPEYIFEEEGQSRDGYFFPMKQISEKRYRFKFWASEYLLDVMRFIRMADHIKITYADKEYNVDSFLITPEWEANGDIAAVQAEFDTATVAKKLGVGIIRNS